MGIFMFVLMTVAVSLIGILMISHYSKQTLSPAGFVEYPAYASFTNQNQETTSSRPPSPSQIQVNLSVMSGPKSGTKIALHQPTLMIERESDKLDLEDSLISRYHAVLKYQDGIWFIKDLDSTNGTFLNGKQLIPRRLVNIPDGSILQVGNTRIGFSQIY